MKELKNGEELNHSAIKKIINKETSEVKVTNEVDNINAYFGEKIIFSEDEELFKKILKKTFGDFFENPNYFSEENDIYDRDTLLLCVSDNKNPFLYWEQDKCYTVDCVSSVVVDGIEYNLLFEEKSKSGGYRGRKRDYECGLNKLYFYTNSKWGNVNGFEIWVDIFKKCNIF